MYLLEHQATKIPYVLTEAEIFFFFLCAGISYLGLVVKK
jgi:hypothetical protein